MTKELEKLGIHVKIIEKDEQNAWNSVNSLTPKIVIGDGSDREVLIEEGLLGCDAVIILTGSDEENIMISLLLPTKSQKIITKSTAFHIIQCWKKAASSIIFPNAYHNRLLDMSEASTIQWAVQSETSIR